MEHISSQWTFPINSRRLCRYVVELMTVILQERVIFAIFQFGRFTVQQMIKFQLVRQNE